MAKSAFNIFESVHSVVSFYMFIVEESIQTVGMSIFLAQKMGNYDDMKALAQWCKGELVDELKEFANGAGILAFPMNVAFDKFADAAGKAMDFYIGMEPPE
jgi:hypothetical protein